MSRGGTKKARAARAAALAKKERAHRQEAKRKPATPRVDRPKVGKGRALLLHLAGLPAPFVASFGLIASGYVSRDGQPLEAGYWLGSVIGDPNAPYWREPAGFLLFGAVMSVTIALFFLSPVIVWRAVYREWPVVARDRSSVDNSFTIIVLALAMWIYRIAAGYSLGFDSFVVLLVMLSVYVPVFSGLLAVILPSIPGSGRIGGVLPDFLKFPFTEKMLLTEPEQEEARAAAVAAKELRRRQYDEARASRRKKK